MTDKKSLTLPEGLLLLALKDESGERSGSFVEYAIAGAALAQLILEGRLAESSEKKGKLVLAHDMPTGDPYLDGCLELIKEIGLTHDPRIFVEKIGTRRQLTDTLHQDLIGRGILRKQTKKFLFIFTRTVYPEADPAAEAALKAHLEEVMFGEGEVSPRDTILVALMREAGLLQVNFDKADLKTHKDRIKMIASGDFLASNIAVEAVQAVKTALIVATVIVPAVVIPATT